MATIPIGLGVLQTAISLTASDFENLASGSLSGLTHPFNVALLANATGAYPDTVDLVLQLGSAVTTGSTPSMQAVLVIARDGTNFEPIAVTNGQLVPYYGGVSSLLIPSQAYTTIVCPGIIVPAVLASGSFATLAFYWNGGVPLPSSLTASLYPSGFAAG